jgi:uncharacterized protein YbaA (DUF1428 family)
MSYVDGFVCAVSPANRDAYGNHAENAARVFKEHGALQPLRGILIGLTQDCQIKAADHGR